MFFSVDNICLLNYFLAVVIRDLPNGIIRPVVSAYIIYIYYWNLQILNIVIINKTKILLPQV